VGGERERKAIGIGLVGRGVLDRDGFDGEGGGRGTMPYFPGSLSLSIGDIIYQKGSGVS